MMKRYYILTKPGIVYGNVFTTVAALFFASRWQLNGPMLDLFVAATVGIALVIAAAGVFNNYLDRNIDKKMARTASRPLAAGTISVRAALIYGTLLLLVGLAMLAWSVNLLTGAIALFGFVMYVFVYGYAKRKSVWGALVGSIPGAVPIVVGYTAVTDRLDAAALLLFLVLVCWQMPHFYAIALRRLDEYNEAGIPVLAAKRRARAVKIHMVAWTAAYLVAVALLFIYGFASYAYLASVLIFGIIWLVIAARGFAVSSKLDDEQWAKRVFLFSLVVLVTFSIALAVAPLLP